MKPETVTQGRWGVSCTTGSGIPGAKLSVSRIEPRPSGFSYDWATGRARIIAGSNLMFMHGHGDGRIFPTVEEAWAWALDHGYLKRHVSRIWCRRCRVLHTFCGKPSAWCPVDT